MIATELISQEVLPVRTTDSGRAALLVMNDQFLKQIPVLEGDEFIALVSEEELLNHPLEAPLSEIVNPNYDTIVSQTEHLFVIMSKMTKLQLSILPVIDADKKYLGAIKQEDVLHYYSKNYALNEPGSILVIELMPRDYSLTEISRVIESEGAHVLHLFLTQNPLHDKITLTIKLDLLEIQPIIATLRRMGYEIVSSYQEQEFVDNLQDRYDALMHYLNL